MEDIEFRNKLITSWFQQAVAYVQSVEHTELEISEKDHWNNLVTEADKSIEAFFVKCIREKFPTEKIMSEEGFGDNGKVGSGITWFIDPIDGTTNFITMQKHYAIMLAVYEEGVGQLAYIYNKDEDALYSAIKGEGIYKNGKLLSFTRDDYQLSEGVIGMNTVIIRSIEYQALKDISTHCLGIRSQGSAGLELLDVALGNQLAFMSSHLSPWDLAAGLVFLKERQLICIQFNGEQPTLNKSEQIIAAYPSTFSTIKRFLKQ